MSKLPFEKDLKEALNKPTLTQRETALTALVEKLQGALVDSHWDKLMAEQWSEEANINAMVLAEENDTLENEVNSLESEIQHLEEQIYDLENELESSEETVAELTEEVDTLSERVEELEEIIESMEEWE